MVISIICAVNESFQIGNSKTNDLLYYIKEDLKRFKELTLNNYVVMGSNTWNSLPNPLPNRTNVIMTRNKKFKVDDELFEKYEIIIHNDLGKVLNHYKESGNQEKDLFIIGGSHLFAEGIHWADRIYLTMIHEESRDDGDVYFNASELSEFKVVKREKKYDEESGLSYSFIDYERKLKED